MCCLASSAEGGDTGKTKENDFDQVGVKSNRSMHA
jgi:hypothetical protein